MKIYPLLAIKWLVLHYNETRCWIRALNHVLLTCASVHPSLVEYVFSVNVKYTCLVHIPDINSL